MPEIRLQLTVIANISESELDEFIKDLPEEAKEMLDEDERILSVDMRTQTRNGGMWRELSRGQSQRQA